MVIKPVTSYFQDRPYAVGAVAVGAVSGAGMGLYKYNSGGNAVKDYKNIAMYTLGAGIGGGVLYGVIQSALSMSRLSGDRNYAMLGVAGGAAIGIGYSLWRYKGFTNAAAIGTTLAVAAMGGLGGWYLNYSGAMQ